ncbi:hypothetical protein ASE30_15190 [Achromobacter sp. Root83]|nr:hypothetical protein ASE30_15190 [Achromobacter sp. Root83]
MANLANQMIYYHLSRIILNVDDPICGIFFAICERPQNHRWEALVQTRDVAFAIVLQQQQSLFARLFDEGCRVRRNDNGQLFTFRDVIQMA